MASGTITTAMIFMWMLNILMVFSQLAINDMTTNGLIYYDCSGTIVSSYSSTVGANCVGISGPDSNNLTDELPIGAVSNSNFYIVDWITSATSWIGKQIDTFTQVVNAPYNMLKTIPLFSEVQFAGFAAIVGIAWWGISLLLIVAFILGR